MENRRQIASYKREHKKRKIKKNHGGKRAGSGRKKLAPTVTIAFRVPAELAEPIKQLVKDFILKSPRT